MVKKITALIVPLVLIASLSGCAKANTAPNTTATTTKATTVQTANTTPTTLTPVPSTTLTSMVAQPPAVPPDYQPLYNELNSELASFETTLNQTWNGKQAQPIIATELAYANGNIGPGLLTAASMDNNRMLLDRLQEMGVIGVVLAIKFPLLKPDFPRSAEYLQFFQNIMTECHQRGIKVLVECGAIFSGTAYSPVQVDWTTYTAATFLQGIQGQLLIIARDIKPDYLTLGNEPTTEEALTGLNITPAVWSDFVSSTIKKIGKSSGILVGAGTGTWENPAYINTLFNMPGLDYIDLHIYALNTSGTLLTKALNYGLQARAAGKRVTVSEAWLWKAAPGELATQVAVSDTIMNRDVFSFWSPLDERFFRDIINLADATNMDFISFFWTRNLFTYLDYSDATKNLTTTDFNRQINQASLAAVQNQTLSLLGQSLKAQIQTRTGQWRYTEFRSDQNFNTLSQRLAQETRPNYNTENDFPKTEPAKPIINNQPMNQTPPAMAPEALGIFLSTAFSASSVKTVFYGNYKPVK